MPRNTSYLLDWLIPNMVGQTNKDIAPTVDPQRGASGSLSSTTIPGNDATMAELMKYAQGDRAPRSMTGGERFGNILQQISIPVSYAQGNRGYGRAMMGNTIGDAFTKANEADRVRGDTSDHQMRLAHIQGIMKRRNVDGRTAKQKDYDRGLTDPAFAAALEGDKNEMTATDMLQYRSAIDAGWNESFARRYAGGAIVKGKHPTNGETIFYDAMTGKPIDMAQAMAKGGAPAGIPADPTEQVEPQASTEGFQQPDVQGGFEVDPNTTPGAPPAVQIPDAPPPSAANLPFSRANQSMGGGPNMSHMLESATSINPFGGPLWSQDPESSAAIQQATSLVRTVKEALTLSERYAVTEQAIHGDAFMPSSFKSPGQYRKTLAATDHQLRRGIKGAQKILDNRENQSTDAIKDAIKFINKAEKLINQMGVPPRLSTQAQIQAYRNANPPGTQYIDNKGIDREVGEKEQSSVPKITSKAEWEEFKKNNKPGTFYIGPDGKKRPL